MAATFLAHLQQIVLEKTYQKGPLQYFSQAFDCIIVSVSS
jgi:hypothetical protein